MSVFFTQATMFDTTQIVCTELKVKRIHHINIAVLFAQWPAGDMFNFATNRYVMALYSLTRWGRATHICVSNLTIIASDNGLSPGRRQAIIWANAEILSIGPLGTNFSEILIEIYIFSFKKMHLKISSGKWRPFCLGLNMLFVVLKAEYPVMTRLTPWPLSSTRKGIRHPCLLSVEKRWNMS